MNINKYLCVIPSPIGDIYTISDGSFITNLFFDEQKKLFLTARDYVITNQRIEFLLLKEWLNQYFKGTKPSFEIPIKLIGTPFQQAVWHMLMQIAYGQTATYGYLSSELLKQGIKACPQAVGQAIHRNPISIIVPCHRVIGSNGHLCGYAGGLNRKIFLLKLEKIKMISITF